VSSKLARETMRRPDLVADFESWLYDEDDDDYERQRRFVLSRIS